MPMENLDGSAHHNHSHILRCSSGPHLPYQRILLPNSNKGSSLLHPSPDPTHLHFDSAYRTLQIMFSHQSQLTKMCLNIPCVLHPSPPSSSRFNPQLKACSSSHQSTPSILPNPHLIFIKSCLCGWLQRT